MPFSFGFKSKSLISLPLHCMRLRTAGQMFHWSDSVEYASSLCAPAYYISMGHKFMDNFFHFNCTSAIANGSLFIYAMADAIHFHFVLLCFFVLLLSSINASTVLNFLLTPSHTQNLYLVWMVCPEYCIESLCKWQKRVAMHNSIRCCQMNKFSVRWHLHLLLLTVLHAKSKRIFSK